MSIKAELPFSLLVRGDGTSTALAASITTAPFLYQTSGNALPPGFEFTEHPSGVVDLALSGFTVTATIADGVVNFTFEPALEADTNYIVTGKFQF